VLFWFAQNSIEGLQQCLGIRRLLQHSFGSGKSACSALVHEAREQNNGYFRTVFNGKIENFPAFQLWKIQIKEEQIEIVLFQARKTRRSAR
jgi:hypothetical protein